MAMIQHETVGLYDRETGEIVYSEVRHPVGECPLCDRRRAVAIRRDFDLRVHLAGVDPGTLHMWSLGCSLRDTAPNRKRITQWWRDMTESMKRSGWVPCFRILEVGRRGYLHLHVVVSGFVDHAVVLDKWRRITGEKSNVNVSSMTGGTRSLARYLTKYLTKGNQNSKPGTYRWLGPLYGLGGAVKAFRRSEGSRYGRYEFLGSTCYQGRKCLPYKNHEDQRKID